MQGDPRIVDLLNRAIRAELTAVDEYWIEARLISNWGLKKIAHGMWRDFKKEHRKHARAFIDRVIFLEGTPATSPNPFTAGTSIEEVFAAALAAEMAMRAIYAEGAKTSDDVGDWVSEELFQDTLVRLERRVKKIETQVELIGTVGLELYAQKKI